MEFWVEELSPAQLAYYEKITNEHNAVKGALKNAVSANEGKELFNGQVFQAYSFKGKVLQELKEATLPKNHQSRRTLLNTRRPKRWHRAGSWPPTTTTIQHRLPGVLR